MRDQWCCDHTLPAGAGTGIMRWRAWRNQARRVAGVLVLLDHMSWTGTAPEPSARSTSRKTRAGLLARRRLESGREAVHQDDAAWQQEVDHRAAGVGAVEGAVPADPRHHRFHLVLVDRGRSGTGSTTDGSMRELMGAS
jgi:hypothetical protein